MENEILKIETAIIEKNNEEIPAIMTAANCGDPEKIDEFIKEIIDTVKKQRMISPPDTRLLLITIIGDVDAEKFADTWRDKVSGDPVMTTFMRKMETADLIVGTPDGKLIGKANLLP